MVGQAVTIKPTQIPVICMQRLTQRTPSLAFPPGTAGVPSAVKWQLPSLALPGPEAREEGLALSCPSPGLCGRTRQ